MAGQDLILGIILLLFFAVGGMVDTYTSYQYFKPKKKPPRWLANFMPIWWLFIYTGFLPFLMIFLASGFKTWVLNVYIVFGILGSVVWDMVFSKIWSGKWISESCITWFWVKIGKRKLVLGFNEKQIVWLHAIRLLLAAILFVILF